MPRLPAPTQSELFQIATSEIERSYVRPNILAYGLKDYPDQTNFHKSTCRGRYIAGGNRGGKTSAEVVEAIWWATDTHPYLKRPDEWGKGPLQLRFVVVDIAKGVEQIILPEMKRWIPRSYLIESNWSKSWDGQNLILTFANGSTIDFVTWGMDMMKLGGVPRHGMFFDEEPPQHIFNECMMRLIDFNGFWVIAGTPVNGMTWTYDLLWEPAQTTLDGQVSTHELSMEKNPYVMAEEEDRDFYFMGASAEEREIREKGHFVARSGLVFPTFSAQNERFIIPADSFQVPKDWVWYSSTDFGINSPTAWLWHAVGPHGQIITFAEHYQNGLNVEQHAAIVKERERGFGKTPAIRVGDPNNGDTRHGASGTSYVMEYAVRGIYINVDLPRNVEIGIEKMQQYLRLRETGSPWGDDHPMWMISSNCVNFIREMKKLRWESYTSDKTAYDSNKKETVHKKDDHTFDSARYFATQMPDLTPIDRSLYRPDEPMHTKSYGDILAEMDNAGVEFVKPRSENEPDWEVDLAYGEMAVYEGESIDF